MSGLHGTLLLEMVVIELRVSPKSSPNLSPWSSPESSPLVQSSPESRFYTYPVGSGNKTKVYLTSGYIR